MRPYLIPWIVSPVVAVVGLLIFKVPQFLDDKFSRRPRPNIHRHPLVEVTDDISEYKCNECKQMGLGKKLKCQECKKYNTHPDCAHPPNTVKHPFLRGCNFEFCTSGGQKYFCEACGKHTDGVFYLCRHCDKVLHLNCARLKPKLTTGDKKELRLKDKMTSECSRCKLEARERRRTTWGYVSKNGECQLHIYCVMKLVAEKTSNGRCKELIRKFKNGALKRIIRPELWINMAAAIASALLGDPTGLVALVPYILTS